MPANKSDRRVRYTKFVLRQALLELMKTTGIDKITVTDICRVADINRGTFYAHYSDPKDLLHQIQDEFYNEMQDSLKLLHASNGAISPHIVTHEMLQHIAQNSALCVILLGEHGDADFLRRIIRIAQEPLHSLWTKHSGIAPAQYDYRYAFVANGSYGVVQRWIQTGMQEPPSEIANLINSLTTSGSGLLLGQSDIPQNQQ